MKGVGIMEKFKSWNEVRTELFSPEEIAESDLRVALMGERVKARKEKGISQRELENLSGVKQPEMQDKCDEETNVRPQEVHHYPHDCINGGLCDFTE